MDANPQVLRQTEPLIRPMTNEPQARPAIGESQMTRTASWGPAEQRLSIDPMRTTDRYRLVMPWSDRV